MRPGWKFKVARSRSRMTGLGIDFHYRPIERGEELPLSLFSSSWTKETPYAGVDNETSGNENRRRAHRQAGRQAGRVGPLDLYGPFETRLDSFGRPCDGGRTLRPPVLRPRSSPAFCPTDEGAVGNPRLEPVENLPSRLERRVSYGRVKFRFDRSPRLRGGKSEIASLALFNPIVARPDELIASSVILLELQARHFIDTNTHLILPL